jgi:hypothetical protein
MSFVPTCRITNSEFKSTKPFEILFDNREILIPGNAVTDVPIMSETYFAMESETMVHFRIGFPKLSEKS